MSRLCCCFADESKGSPLRKYHPGEPPVVTDHQPATESPLFGKRSLWVRSGLARQRQ